METKLTLFKILFAILKLTFFAVVVLAIAVLNPELAFCAAVLIYRQFYWMR